MDEKSDMLCFNSRSCSLPDVSCEDNASSASSHSIDESDGLFNHILGHKSESVDDLINKQSGEMRNSQTEVSQYGQSLFYSSKDDQNICGNIFLLNRSFAKDKFL